ncbi:MAG: SCO1664 family protein [Actinobacteria bacterium]|nr:SCO1664 family protein [Actinomycetota bacterium]
MSREDLAEGELEVLGRMPWSSNGTFLGCINGEGGQIVVYKPRRGERPLWDFPHGSLCAREVASFELSEALGWSIVPETVLRDGPLGTGSVQRFVEHDPDEHYFTLLETHEEAFRKFAVFDVLANNADRKAGHCLRAQSDGHVWGIDHGLTFHPQDKLRTVIWDFAGERLDAEHIEAVRRVAADGSLRDRLASLLSPVEADALVARAEQLARAKRFPEPDPGYHSVPWPLV